MAKHPNAKCPEATNSTSVFYKSLRGCGRGGGADRAVLTRAHLALAKRVLAAFDVLELTEDLDQGLARAFGCDAAGRHDRKARGRRNTHPLPAEFRDRFRAENALDEELYAFVVDLVTRRANESAPVCVFERRRGQGKAIPKSRSKSKERLGRPKSPQMPGRHL